MNFFFLNTFCIISPYSFWRTTINVCFMSQLQEEYKPVVETLENKHRTKQKSHTKPPLKIEAVNILSNSFQSV